MYTICETPLFTKYCLVYWTQEEYEEFKKMDNYNKKEYIYENGEIIIDDYDMDDYGEIINIQE